MTQGNATRVQAAILDWAGTVVDFGCMAPAETFLRLVESIGSAALSEAGQSRPEIGSKAA